MRFHYLRVHRLSLATALGLVLALAITACSSSTSSSGSAGTSAPAATGSAAAQPPATTSPASSGGGSAVAQITANWEAFFNSSTPNSKRVQLLENGSSFASAVSAFASSPLATSVTSKVDSVTVTSSTKATVKYDLAAAGTTVAKGASGSAVLQDGVWKVGDDVFCGLLQQGAPILNIKVPSACK